jgi:hypothetical protein
VHVEWDALSPHITSVTPYARLPRFYPFAEFFRLLSTGMTSRDRGACRLEGPLSTPPLSYHWDHRVRGAVVVPGATMLEAACAVSWMLGAAGHADRQTAFVDGSIPAPAELSLAAPLVLQCEVAIATGALVIRSVRGRGAARAHVMCSIAAAPHVASGQTDRQGRLGAAAARAGMAAGARRGGAGVPVAVGSMGLSMGGARLRDRESYAVHPTLLDNNFHVGAQEQFSPAHPKPRTVD